MATSPIPCNDPVIQISIQYPDNVQIPAQDAQFNVYRASVILKNASKLPVETSSAKVTLDDTIQGYDVELWDDKQKRPIDTAVLTVGSLDPEEQKSADFLFRVKKTWPMPPKQSGRSMTFHVMPSYEVHCEAVDGFCSQTSVVVKGTDLGGGSGWKTNPPEWQEQPDPADPLIALEQGFFSTLYAPLAGWGTGAWVACHLKVTNNAPVPITSFKYQIAVDDTLANYDVKCTGESGGWDQSTLSRDLGPINPGVTTDSYTYWISVFHLEGADQAAETGTALLQVAPWYTVEYRREDAVSKSIPVAT
jgi:hypothetical protein